MLTKHSPIHVRKLRPDGSQAYAWDGTILRCDAQGLVLRATFNVDVVELGFTTLRRGDEFVEFYYWDRPYNVFQISAPDGALKGWYANLGLPAELTADGKQLLYVDLALDVWVHPDGQYVVLDQDELAALLLQRPDLTEVAACGRRQLLELADRQRMPCWPSEGDPGGRAADAHGLGGR